MKEIKNILHNVMLMDATVSVSGSVDALVFDSRKANATNIFIALRGSSNDGHEYIQNVIDQGCKYIVCEAFSGDEKGAIIYRVSNSATALGIMASNFYGNPSSKLKLIGITGTNGKTTTATLLHALFTDLGYKVGLLSTVVNKIGDVSIPATHTTPEPVALNHLLSEMVAQDCTHCFMEVSSHAVHQQRISGLSFDGGIFTNITHDHLDYHKTFAEYIKAKKGFFDALGKNAFALTNNDDKNGMVMLQNTLASAHTYSLKSDSEFKLKILENQFSGLVVKIDGEEVWTKLIGDFNGYNLLAVYGTAILLGEQKIEVLTALSQLKSVDGRFEYIRSVKGLTVIVDYAHTPDALENVLKTIKNIRTNNETVFTIFGCGGDRDTTKRPIMAAIACELSDKVILTTDNPRTEDSAQILNEMEAGVPAQHFKKTLTIQDRKEAIKTAISMAQANDIVLIAGKGHEKYQDIKGVKHPFDDVAVAYELIQKLEK
jgi:UDP-N-acetylmuramoyl-L-alanyl-D-glutamate--2,6-diaminopimelate ligase